MESKTTCLATIAIVDVYGADRAAHAKRKLAGQALLPWLVRRVTDADRIQKVIAIVHQLSLIHI